MSRLRTILMVSTLVALPFAFRRAVAASTKLTAAKPSRFLADAATGKLSRSNPAGRATHAALVLGGSGSVGRSLVSELAKSERYDPIIAVVRGSLEKNKPDRVQEKIVNPMTPEALSRAVEEVAAELPAGATLVGFTTLGVGKDTDALTIDQHRAVDVFLNKTFAKAVQDTGKAKAMCMLSALGADSTSSMYGPGAPGFPRYNKVKGEAEDAVGSVGPRNLIVFRPALIVGSDHTPDFASNATGALSKILPGKAQSVHKETIARAMVQAPIDAAMDLDAVNEVEVCYFPDMIELEKRFVESTKRPAA